MSKSKEAGTPRKSLSRNGILNGDSNAIIQIVKDIAKQDEVQVYTVRGFEGRFEVFVFAKMNDDLIRVKGMGVAR